MRILHLLNDVRELGNGIINVAVDLMIAQAAAGHSVAVASAGGEFEALLAARGVHHYRLEQRQPPLAFMRAITGLAEIVRAEAPEIVHAHMRSGALLAWMLRGVGAYALVTTVHIINQRSSLLMGVGDRVIAVSEAVAEAMAAQGLPAHKLDVVLNGTLGGTRAAAAEAMPLRQPAIVMVAGMIPPKGVHDVLAAFELLAADHPEAHLYMVGDGPALPELRSRAALTPFAERIHLEGFQRESRRYLQAAQIVVLGSHIDSCPLVLLEAREAGCAIVATAVGGIPEALGHGAYGCLVSPQDPPGLARAMAGLLAAPERRRALQLATVQDLERFSVGRMAQETEQIYRKVLGLRQHQGLLRHAGWRKRSL